MAGLTLLTASRINSIRSPESVSAVTPLARRASAFWMAFFTTSTFGLLTTNVALPAITGQVGDWIESSGLHDLNRGSPRVISFASMPLSSQKERTSDRSDSISCFNPARSSLKDHRQHHVRLDLAFREALDGEVTVKFTPGLYRQPICAHKIANPVRRRSTKNERIVIITPLPNARQWTTADVQCQ